MNSASIPRAPDGSSPCHPRSPRRAILIVAAIALGSFIAGYAAGNRRSEERCRQDGHRQFLEFLTVADDLGIVTIDRQKLNEVICTDTKAELEDNDAVEAAKGGQP